MTQIERDLRRYTSQEMPRRKRFWWGMSAGVLQEIGIPPHPMMISGAILKKAIEKHSLSVKQLVAVQRELNSPLMVFKSCCIPHSMLLLTSVTAEQARSVVVILNQSTRGHKNPINEIKSIHPSPSEIILLEMEMGLLLAADKIRSQQWLENLALGSDSARYLAIMGQVKSLTPQRQSQGGIKLW